MPCDPQDHAPGKLIRRATGGVAAILDGNSYLPVNNDSHLLAARGQAARTATQGRLADLILPSIAWARGWDPAAMAIISFLVHLLSGATLLLFAVRFMRIGIERLWSNQIRQSLGEASATLPLLAKGAALGFAMQGATVVMLMAAGMVGSNAIPLVSAALLAIGADFGSALAVRFLTLPVAALGPFAILTGGWLYLNSREARRKNLGRVILGLGLIFMSLGVIRDAVEPLQALSEESPLMSVLQGDPITAAIIGIALTLLMHSSLAAILTGLFIAAHAGLGPLTGLGFVLGCNIGSALLPLWLLRNETADAMHLARIIAVLRCGLAALLLAGLVISDELVAQHLPDAETAILLGHIGFNFILLWLAPIARYMARRPQNSDRSGQVSGVVTIPGGESDPEIIVTALKGGLNQMLSILTGMFEQVTAASPEVALVTSSERQMNRALSDIRLAFADLPQLPEDASTEVRNIVDFAIRIERCADILADKYLEIRQEQLNGEFAFSSEGDAEIATLAEEVRKALILAQKVTWTGDYSAARRLVLHKQSVSKLEEKSRRKHLQRVSTGNLTSLSSSNQHLELIAALKEVNSKLSTIAYAVLESHGGLKKTRLRDEDRRRHAVPDPQDE
ncbi:Na/Pi cotransporter family protein [Paracoccus tegillarcae]|uniref:Na/Pi cotransporter family protein n=1 Tax=Paracoccus tegillarcae TaxID=1529068 RepID=UPI001300183A|nr:Na/Pi symporter [Paracoccus tegillarcae]